MPVSVDEIIPALSEIEQVFAEHPDLSLEQVAKDLAQEAKVAREINRDKEVDPRVRLQAGKELRENRVAVAKMLGWFIERHQHEVNVNPLLVEIREALLKDAETS